MVSLTVGGSRHSVWRVWERRGRRHSTACLGLGLKDVQDAVQGALHANHMTLHDLMR